LLSTPLHSDAVTFGYGVVASSGMDFHHADVAPSRAHSFPHALSGNPGETKPGPPIKTFGGDVLGTVFIAQLPYPQLGIDAAGIASMIDFIAESDPLVTKVKAEMVISDTLLKKLDDSEFIDQLAKR
jgi:hypothetical protein